MSDSTKAALDAAIAAHIADEYGDAVAAWTVVAGVVTLEDGENAIALETSSSTAQYVQRGLLHEAIALLDIGNADG